MTTDEMESELKLLRKEIIELRAASYFEAAHRKAIGFVLIHCLEGQVPDIRERLKTVTQQVYADTMDTLRTSNPALGVAVDFRASMPTSVADDWLLVWMRSMGLL